MGILSAFVNIHQLAFILKSKARRLDGYTRPGGLYNVATNAVTRLVL